MIDSFANPGTLMMSRLTLLKEHPPQHCTGLCEFNLLKNQWNGKQAKRNPKDETRQTKLKKTPSTLLRFGYSFSTAMRPFGLPSQSAQSWSVRRGPTTELLALIPTHPLRFKANDPEEPLPSEMDAIFYIRAGVESQDHLKKRAGSRKAPYDDSCGLILLLPTDGRVMAFTVDSATSELASGESGGNGDGDGRCFLSQDRSFEEEKTNSTVALYLQIGGKWFFDSTIKPHILNVNVTYNSTGFVTLEPLLQTSTNPAINTSSVISTIISALTYHLYIAQAPDMNLAVEGIFGAYNTYPSSGVGDYEPLAGLVAAYIRGVIEDEATNLRYELPNWVPEVPQQPVPVMIYETFVFWGPASPKHKLLVVAAPLLIMLSTIVILLVAFYCAWSRHWTESNMSFDSMSIIHLVIASSIGEVQLGSLDFTGYNAKGVYDKAQNFRCRLSALDARGREPLQNGKLKYSKNTPGRSELPLTPLGTSRS
ncbi:hypothetical protein F5887DRAFT_920561 [Amanita rubescens]|nr:hypothetical protein F5887DRAFT_920561 [Amanita rubescens]